MNGLLIVYLAFSSLFFLSMLENAEEDRPKHPMLAALALPLVCVISVSVFVVVFVGCKVLGVDTREIF